MPRKSGRHARPTAEKILTDGTAIAQAGEITVDNLKDGTTYVIAVAASNKEVYSEVKSIEMATDKDLSGPAVFDRQVAGGYYGIPEGGRYGEYLVILADGEAVGADGVYATIGAGRTMSLNLYQFAPTNMNNIVLPDRTYKYATDKSISTFHPAKTYCMVNDGKGNITKVEFKAGTIAVTKSGLDLYGQGHADHDRRQRVHGQLHRPDYDRGQDSRQNRAPARPRKRRHERNFHPRTG